MGEINFHVFPMQNPVSVVDLYRLYSQGIQESNNVSEPSWYVCAPVTSAVTQEDFGLPVDERKKLNFQRATAHLHQPNVLETIGIDRVVLPVLVGDRTEEVPWDESKYYIFMLMVMLGVQSSDAESFVEGVQPTTQERATMSAYSMTLEQRIASYSTVADKVIGVAKGMVLRPLHVLVTPKANISPGCVMERKVIEGLGHNISDIVYASGVARVVKRS